MNKLVISAGIAALAVSAPSAAADIMAMCSTSRDGGPAIVTSIAPVAMPKNAPDPRTVKQELGYAVLDTMRALGMTYDQTAGCSFIVPSMPLQDGNQTEETLRDFQRRLIELGYKLVAVDRLDAGAAVKQGAGTPPPDKHDDGAPLRFFLTVGLVPTASDTRNPMCTSNIVTLTDKVDWKEWGSSGRADELSARFIEPFKAACAQLGTMTPPPLPVFDRGDGQFRYAPHPTDRMVTLTP